jgi:hypothetical protein
MSNTLETLMQTPYKTPYQHEQLRSAMKDDYKNYMSNV